ncbi:MAG: FAD-dependent protein [Syntrophomonas sp.]
MRIRVRELKLPLDHNPDRLIEAAARRLGIGKKDISSLKLVKKAVDARRETVCFTYTIDLELNDGVEIPGNALKSAVIISPPQVNGELLPGPGKLSYSPVIVGAGPAGLFCALYLARHGYKPVVFEQGEDIDRRIKTVERFWKEGQLDPLSNIQFGEGGAGSFSDGKLTARTGDERIPYVLETFVQYGANEEILYVKKPHVGTDIIRIIVKRIRQEIIDLGGEFFFNARLTDININRSYLKSIIINNETKVPCSVLILAVGNSARDIYRMLHRKSISLQAKAFAVGLRVEHPQGLIDRIQYGKFAGHPRLGAADYHLTYQDEKSERSLYTFCMCPGGYVVAAASGPEQVVTNGMSCMARDSGIANSALVVTVNPSDWDHRVLGGMELQEELEKRAFLMGGGRYRAPAQLLQDFLAKNTTRSLEGSLATYLPGVTPTNLWELFPREIGDIMFRGIEYWGKKMKGFINERAVLTGVETRTSAPLRIERDKDLCALDIHNLYPCGEGAGYAGGIISSAVDGLKVAEKIITSYQRPGRMVKIKDDNMYSAREL